MICRPLFLILLLSFSMTAQGLSIYDSHFVRNPQYDELLKDRPPLDREMLRKMYHVDEWAMFPQADEKKFILFKAGPSSSPSKIYGNKELYGNPIFFLSGSRFFPYVTDMIVDPKTGMTPGTCFFTRSRKKKKVKEWLDCSKTPCEIIKNEKGTEVEVLDPYTTFWYLGEKWKDQPVCPFKVPFQVYIDNPGMKDSERQYFYLKPLEVTLNYASFEMDGKTYYLDLRGVPRLTPKDLMYKEIGQGPFIHDFWTKPLVYTDYDMRWILMKSDEVYKHYKDFFQKVQKCAVEKNINCLKQLSYTKERFANDASQVVDVEDFKPIVWDEKNIKEVIACTKPGTYLPGPRSLLLGITKKCVFKGLGKYQLIYIDIPEAFKLDRMFNEKFEVTE